MNTIQALVIAALQGATELFPVSSLGHAVILPALLRWNIDQHGPEFLPFLVLLHTGTAVALLLYFRRDWIALASGVVDRDPHVAAQARRVVMLIVVATLPAVVVGAVLQKPLRVLFSSPIIAALFLVANGGLLILAERLKGRVGSTPATVADPSPASTEVPISSLSVRDAFAIGCWQCLAFLPGISRSGSTIAGALLRGIEHRRAAHFSFLIALPVIVGATVLEVPHLLHAGVAPGTFSLALIAAAVSGVVAYLSTAFLMHWFRDHEKWALDPFAWYCIVAGTGAAAILWF